MYIHFTPIILIIRMLERREKKEREREREGGGRWCRSERVSESIYRVSTGTYNYSCICMSVLNLT